jgi:hypothetical protein
MRFLGWKGCFEKRKVIPTIGYTFGGRGGRVGGMKSEKLEYWSKGIMGQAELGTNMGRREMEYWSDVSATDETRMKHGCGKGTLYKDTSKSGSPEPEAAGGGKTRPTPKAFGAGLAWIKRCLEPWWGGAGYRNTVNRVGKFNGSCHLTTASCRFGRGFYRIATASCCFIWKCYRFLPYKSMQVVDFPHLAYVGLFWGGLQIDLATDAKRSLEPIWGKKTEPQRMEAQRQAKLGTTLRDRKENY